MTRESARRALAAFPPWTGAGAVGGRNPSIWERASCAPRAANAVRSAAPAGPRAAHRHDARERLHDGGLSVRHGADGADVDGRLRRNEDPAGAGRPRAAAIVNPGCAERARAARPISGAH